MAQDANLGQDSPKDETPRKSVKQAAARAEINRPEDEFEQRSEALRLGGAFYVNGS